jgi:hypothetical protein
MGDREDVVRELGKGGAAGLVAGVLVATVLAGACSHSAPKAKIAKLPVASTTTSAAAPAGGAGPGGGAKGAEPAGGPTSTAGGDGSGGKAAFLVAANALCRAADDKLAKVGDDVSGPTASQEAGFLTEGAGIEQAQLDQMRALPAPGGDTTDLQTYYSYSQKEIALLHTTAAGLAAGDASVMDTLESEGKSLTTAGEEAADRYGLTDCGTARGDS